MCIRCLRNVTDDDIDNKLGDDNFSIAGTEDGDNQSLISNEMGSKTYHSSVSFQVSIYRLLSSFCFCSCFCIFSFG